MTGYSFNYFFILILIGSLISPPLVGAVDVPSYSSSPSAELRTSPSTELRTSPSTVVKPSPATRMAQARCTLTARQSNGNVAPIDIQFVTKSIVNGQRVDQFIYDFGDGNKLNGGEALSHRYDSAGTYQITAQPVVDSTLIVNPCKMTVTLTSQKDALPEAASSSVALAPATIVTQPETGPSSVYWLSLAGLFTIWLGAELWYRHNLPTIG